MTAKETSVQVRLTWEERERLDEKAAAENTTASEWIRARINEPLSVAKELRGINSKLKELKTLLQQ